jgi:hypothetical protein
MGNSSRELHALFISERTWLVGWLIYSCCCHLEHRACVKRFVLLQFLVLRHSVVLLGRVISPSQDLDWDSNPRSQRSGERRQFMPQTAQPLWSALRQHIEKKIYIVDEYYYLQGCDSILFGWWILRCWRDLPSPSSSYILKIEVTWSSATLGVIYQTTWRHIQEDTILHRHRRENTKFLTDTWRMYDFPWRWRKQFASKNWSLFTELHGVTPRRE